MFHFISFSPQSISLISSTIIHLIQICLIWLLLCYIIIQRCCQLSLDKVLILDHSYKKRKDEINVKYLGWPYRAYNKTAKNGNFCEKLLSENDFEAVLATFCCYDHAAKVSEAVQKISTDQKDYRKCSLWVIICWIAKIYLSINNSEKWLVTRIPPT